MAKKKGAPKGAPVDRRTIVLSMKGSVEFRDWLARAADSERLTTVQLLERAVVDYMKRQGFAEPPPKRTEGR